nr:protein kinase [Kofleriaceae bacterium]
MRQPVPFGKYLLLDRISVGGMAEVFKAKSYGVEGFEKIIAIKRILPTMGEDRDFIKMFIDEAKIAGQLAHANICQIFELGRIDGSHFIAMEYIWGKDLLQIQNRLRKLKQPMPVAMACFIIAKSLEGLDYAHRKRDPLGRPLEIVHRDCSPQNVLVSYEGEVKVIDFGIAKATSRNSRTMAGVLKGKFGYMSPEQVRGLPLDRRSDIFALGTMLYECLTSERLFQGETDFSTLEKVRNVDIRPPREVNPNIPEHVERVILKALAKDVDDRYQWCSEMLADIQQYLMSQDVVFTAKSLSSWLKEAFSPEIDRERQQLESYKRVGRDGLIQGVPAAEAKVDVVASLGEAGVPEGDATQLGGPSFEEMEGMPGAPPPAAPPPSQGNNMQLGRAGAQNSGAAMNPAGMRTPPPAMEAGPPPSQGPKPLGRPSGPSPLGPLVAPPQPAPPPRARPSEDDDGFGEEAPTEIFGDLDNQSKPNPAPGLAGAPAAPQKKPQGTPGPVALGAVPAPQPPPKRVAKSEPGIGPGSADRRTPAPDRGDRGDRPQNATMPLAPGMAPSGAMPAQPGSNTSPPPLATAPTAITPAPELLRPSAPPPMPQQAQMAAAPQQPQQQPPQQHAPAPEPMAFNGGDYGQVQQPQQPQQHDYNNGGYNPYNPYGQHDPNAQHQQPQQQYDQYGQPMMGMGTPGSMPMVSNGGQQPAKTMLGQQAPMGMGQYGQQPMPGGYRPTTQPGTQAPQNQSGQVPAMPYGHLTPPGQPQQLANPYGYPQQYDHQQPQYDQQLPQYDQQPPQQQYDQYGQPINPSQPHLQPYQMQQQPEMGNYPSQPMGGFPMQGHPQHQMASPADPPIEGRKKSTLVRDIIIGVVIAGVVLCGFLAVKFFVLDADDSGSIDSSSSTIASVKIKLPSSVTAAVYVDDKKDPEFKAVVDGQTLPIAAGKRHLRIEASQGKCEKDVDLPGGEITELECPLGGGAGSAAPANSGSAVPSGTGSAGTTTGSGTGSAGKLTGTGTGSATPSGAGTGSATQIADATKKPPDTTVKPPDTTRKPPDTTTQVKPPDTTTNKKPPDTTAGTSSKTDQGYLVVTCKPPAKISVDGAATGLTTPIGGKTLPLPAGKHKITFSIGEDKYSFWVTINAGQTTPITKDFGP